MGKEIAKKLESVGICSSEDLKSLGAEEAFVRLKESYPKCCLVHLYTLEGAITDQDYNNLPPSRKKELKEFSDFLKPLGQKTLNVHSAAKVRPKF
ncbi:TfoX/Sxy family DNA transformation protein [Helicobacter sp. MIT 21-1697]|nr:TfoX/Sxy family DNA transformation protein [Helicobacter sp. MIT 21-1697]